MTDDVSECIEKNKSIRIWVLSCAGKSIFIGFPAEIVSVEKYNIVSAYLRYDNSNVAF
ncbi:hypothetical protein EZS27_000394 [termite gut metagenome]|uniref:Uncharacterized protein n=1 Tax=termite gut metagenome TaxID=433724 RepID=A0A5J4T2R9_9ZZZZ